MARKDEPTDRDLELYRARLARALGGDIIARWDKEDAEFEAELTRRMVEVRNAREATRK